jgi:LysM repeat protein
MKRAFENSCIKGCAVYLVALVLVVALSAFGLGSIRAKLGLGTAPAAQTTQQGAAAPTAPEQSPAQPGSSAPQAAQPTPMPQAQAQTQPEQALPTVAVSTGPLGNIQINILPSNPTATPAPAQQQAQPTQQPQAPVPPPVESSYAPQTQAQGGEISGQALAPFYIVQGGDTLSSIAAQFGTTVEALRETNKLSDANSIWPGQLLYLPLPGQPQGQTGGQGGGDAGASVPPPVAPQSGTDQGSTNQLPNMPDTGINTGR